ncbi:hypothetical protein HID58_066475, partial [Brassica napus]
MSTRRRSRFCKSTRIRSICGVRGSDRIHSKDFSDALTENGNTKRFSSKPGQQEPVIGMSLEHINQSVNPRR